MFSSQIPQAQAGFLREAGFFHCGEPQKGAQYANLSRQLFHRVLLFRGDADLSPAAEPGKPVAPLPCPGPDHRAPGQQIPFGGRSSRLCPRHQPRGSAGHRPRPGSGHAGGGEPLPHAGHRLQKPVGPGQAAGFRAAEAQPPQAGPHPQRLPARVHFGRPGPYPGRKSGRRSLGGACGLRGASCG